MTERGVPFERIADREQKLLAPFAFASSMSAGRRYLEPVHPFRGPFQRDRDRILHSAAFRRLSGKMQVFTGDFGDYHRTRLTHTMEVASVARTIGRAFRLNEDLIEALALLHDLGHPPFGHAGEDALADCLRDDGGFSHNRFGLTLVEELEQRYADFPGLNLSVEVLQCQQTRAHKDRSFPRPLLEAQVVDCADAMAYNAHDVDDGLKLQLVTWEQLQTVPLVDRLIAELPSDVSIKMRRQAIVRRLLDIQVMSVLQYSGPFLFESGWTSFAAATESDFVIDMDPSLREARKQLAAFLHKTIYRHDRLLSVREQAQQEIRWLFDYFQANPEDLPAMFQTRAEEVGSRRSIGDYLAGMTDRYCHEQYQRFRESRPTPA